MICVSTSRGLQQYTSRLVNALATRAKLTVFGQSELTSSASANIEAVVISKNRRSPVSLLKLIFLLLEKRHQIIHIQGINLVTLLCAIALRPFFRQRKIVLTPHNVNTHFPNRVYNMIKWSIWSKFDRIILHTKSEVRFVPSYLRKKISIVPHGEYSEPNVDFENVTNLKEIESINKYIIFAGYIRDDKNLDFILNNVKEFERWGYSLVVAGLNKSSIPDVDIANKCIFINRFLTDMELVRLIKQASYTILPYDKVSESGILHASLSVGTPILCTRLPEFEERIQNTINGMFIEELGPKGLRSCLMDAEKCKFDRAKIRDNHLEEYSWNSISKLTLEAVS